MKDLKSIRIAMGITQQQLSVKTELSNITISNIENKVTIPQDDVRRRIEIALGCRVNWLKTLGLKPSFGKNWEALESDLRSLLNKVLSFSTLEQKQFIELVKIYIQTTETLLKDQDYNFQSIQLKELTALKKTRKHKKSTI